MFMTIACLCVQTILTKTVLVITSPLVSLISRFHKNLSIYWGDITIWPEAKPSYRMGAVLMLFDWTRSRWRWCSSCIGSLQEQRICRRCQALFLYCKAVCMNWKPNSESEFLVFHSDITIMGTCHCIYYPKIVIDRFLKMHGPVNCLR